MLKVLIPENLEDEIQELSLLIEKYKKGEIDKTSLKAHRVPFGVYEQRKDDTYMVRVRCTAGIITPLQFGRVAELSRQYGGEDIHITTRQEVQIHNVKLSDLILVIRALKDAGLSSRGGGGNTVRNIAASVDSGIDPEEVFDVAPYAVALTSRFVSEGDSWSLPRKYKLAFSSSQSDTAFATIADLGFIAAIKNGRKGFKVYGAGGMGAKSAPGKLLFDFIPEDEVYLAAEGMKQLFNKFGNRKNRYAARIRFLWDKIGGDEFKKHLLEEIEILKKQGVRPLEVREDNNSAAEVQAPAENPENGERFLLWKERYVKSQKQEGLYSIKIPVLLGDVKNEAASNLADFLLNFGENVMRFSQDQNIHLRNIPEAYLETVYRFIRKTFPQSADVPIYGNIVSCAGASTCKLGICLSRGAARAVVRSLGKTDADLDRASDVSIHISGCPNSCGQHLTGDIGFYGIAARNEDRLYPAYVVTGGAVVKEGQSAFGEKLGEISARKLPEFTKEVIVDYTEKSAHYESFRDYLDHGGKDFVQGILKEKYSEISDFEDDKNFYFDWESEELFSLASRGTGECSAGLFDFIERDLKNIDDRKKALSVSSNVDDLKKYSYELLYYSARVLLITRGIESDRPEVIFPAFVGNFIATGIFKGDDTVKDLLKKAEAGESANLLFEKDRILQFSNDIVELYQRMDDSLNFKPAAVIEPVNGKAEDKTGQAAKLFKDLRGVACPMNFVKTKIELSKIKSGETLEIFLDNGAPIENVPRSVETEGHRILSQEKIGDYWKVVITKGNS